MGAGADVAAVAARGLAEEDGGPDRVVRRPARRFEVFAPEEGEEGRPATLYSLIESCKAVGVEPFAYFAEFLARTATASARELLPRAWKAARDAAQAAQAAGPKA